MELDRIGTPLDTPTPVRERLAYRLSDPIESSAFIIPSVLAGFQVFSVSQYPEPKLGFQVKLRFSADPEILADIYVHPVLLPDLMSLADILDFE